MSQNGSAKIIGTQFSVSIKQFMCKACKHSLSHSLPSANLPTTIPNLCCLILGIVCCKKITCLRIRLNFLFPAATLDRFPVIVDAFMPMAIRPPETFLCDWDCSADIWNLGVMVRRCLQIIRLTLFFTYQISHTHSHINLLGLLSPHPQTAIFQYPNQSTAGLIVAATTASTTNQARP